VIVPIWRKESDLRMVKGAVERIVERLSPVTRIKVDWRDDRSAGFKFNEWELKGVPIRLEIGPRDVASNQVVAVRRDTREKTPLGVDTLADSVPHLLNVVQRDLFAAAKRMQEQHTVIVDDYAEMATRVADNAGWNLAHWCGDPACEAKVKLDTKATSRCIPFDQAAERGPCIVCGTPDSHRVIFARAY
jgi:prolyl-tRNA synthetase